MTSTPFSIDIPQATLDDLRRRLATTRWPDGMYDAGWDYGTNRGYLEALATCWRDRFDWPAQEAALNRFAQFRAEIDGLDIHYVHERGKGPRGGGRDRDTLLDHVGQADRSYARQLGVRTQPFDSFDLDAVQAHHEAAYAAIPDRRDGLPLTGKGWPVRYAIRRMAWHVLGHAWEMQAKDLTGQEQT